MRRRSRPLLGLLPLIGALAVACGPPRYEPPELHQPHATVVVRVIHHTLSGRDLAHTTLLNGFGIDIGERPGVVRGAPITRTVRVRPESTRWRFRSHFSHTEQRMETVYETERYSCGTQTTGYGASSRTTTRYCTRQVPRQRMRTVRVTDGVCEAETTHTPRIDRRYVIQFDYHANGQCRARCFQQTPQAGGDFRLTPCGSPVPPSPARTPAAAPARPPSAPRDVNRGGPAPEPRRPEWRGDGLDAP